MFKLIKNNNNFLIIDEDDKFDGADYDDEVVILTDGTFLCIHNNYLYIAIGKHYYKVMASDSDFRLFVYLQRPEGVNSLKVLNLDIENFIQLSFPDKTDEWVKGYVECFVTKDIKEGINCKMNITFQFE